MSSFNAHQYIAGKMFIGGLSSRTTEENLHKYFEQFGEIFDCVLMMDKSTGRSRGFGFVTMVDPSLADEIMLKRPHSIDGRQVDIKRAIPKGDDSDPKQPEPKPKPLPKAPPAAPASYYQASPPRAEVTLAQLRQRNQEAQRILETQRQSRKKPAGGGRGGEASEAPELNRAKIFVGGLTQDTSERDLRRHFEQFGEIVDAVVMYERQSKRSRGFGFVTFASQTVAKYVLEWRKEHIVRGRSVDVKRATPKDGAGGGGGAGEISERRRSSRSPPPPRSRAVAEDTSNLYKADARSAQPDIYHQAANLLLNQLVSKAPPPPQPAAPVYHHHAHAHAAAHQTHHPHPHTHPHPHHHQYAAQGPLPAQLPLAANLLGSALLGGAAVQAQPRAAHPPPPGAEYQEQDTRLGQLQQQGALPHHPPLPQYQTGAGGLGDTMATEIILQAYRKMMQEPQPPLPYYQKPLALEEEKQQDAPGAGGVGSGAAAPATSAALLAPLEKRAAEIPSFQPRQPAANWTTPYYPGASAYISQDAPSKPTSVYDFSNPNQNLQQMVIPDDSWGPMKEAKSTSGHSVVKRAGDRLTDKPY